jgi:hypothetical protein
MGFFSFLKYSFIIFVAHLATSCRTPFENHWFQLAVTEKFGKPPTMATKQKSLDLNTKIEGGCLSEVGRYTRCKIGRRDELSLMLFIDIEEEKAWYILNPRKVKAHFHMT